jgi:hypothetical protein
MAAEGGIVEELGTLENRQAFFMIIRHTVSSYAAGAALRVRFTGGAGGAGALDVPGFPRPSR